MLRQLCCSLLAQCPLASARSNPDNQPSKMLFSTMFYHKLTHQKLRNKLPDRYELQIEQRYEEANPNSANLPNTEIAKIDYNTSTSRPLRLKASSRHLGETMGIINQPNFETGLNKPLRRTSASSWGTA